MFLNHGGTRVCLQVVLSVVVMWHSGQCDKIWHDAGDSLRDVNKAIIALSDSALLFFFSQIFSSENIKLTGTSHITSNLLFQNLKQIFLLFVLTFVLCYLSFIVISERGRLDFCCFDIDYICKSLFLFFFFFLVHLCPG